MTSLEHLLRYCARPAFALERLSLLPGRNGSSVHIRYSLPRHKRGQWVGPGRKRTATAPGTNGVVDLSPGEFLDRLADLVPPPRKHRHRYHGVFAPNHPLRPAVTALAIGHATARAGAEPVQVHDDRDAIQASPEDLPVIDIRSL
ncbi:MAG: transposase [Planctomycetota bacterium]